MSALSIVVPTRDRWTILEQCLTLLEEQIQETDSELFIVDDGSADGTAEAVRVWIERRDLNVNLLVQQRSGPAAARNRGLKAAANELILFLGDDIYPAPDLLRRHLEHHARFPDAKVAALGHVTWNPELRITPLMHWLENGGPQFCYHRIEDPLNVPHTFFWTANLSAKATFLKEAGGFSVRFPFAAFEDVELGLRLGKKGLMLHYEPSALGYHHHAMTLSASLERMRRLAAGALLASQTEPDLVFVGHDPLWRRIRRRFALHPAILRAVQTGGPFFASIPGLRERYFAFVHDLFYKAELRKLMDQ